MKADQSSIFRHLEVLHLWCAETFDNAPKNEVVREDVRILVQNIVQAQSAVAMALQAQTARGWRHLQSTERYTDMPTLKAGHT